MEKNQLNINNSKKLIIGVSILFCTVILIVGTTLAFFTQSDTKEIGNIVSADQVTLLFDDNNDYMFGQFIPVNEEDVLKFASKDTDICKYQEGMYACNLYEFTITNNSNVTQELIITLNPTINEFSNLYYMLFENNKDNIYLDNVPVSKEKINETNSIEIANKVVLGAKTSKTYTIVYYVKNLEDIDQTSMDAGKQFYAKVRVDSITTGTYAETLMESRCYKYEEITEGEYAGTYKLTTFNGIDENGVADNTCGVAENGEFYSIDVPSKIKDEEGNELEVSTLGNKLFAGIICENGNETINERFSKINKFKIEEGIKEIEDGIYNESSYTMYGTFFYHGFDFETGDFGTKTDVILPSSLNKIGDMSFAVTNIYEIKIPYNVELVGKVSFMASLLSKISFEVDENGSSNLNTIDMGAFDSSSKLSEIEIPYSVTFIKEYAFNGIETLEKLTFLGDLEDTTNSLTIGINAFYRTNLNYSTNDNPLVIPARVTSIGENAFSGDTSTQNNLKFIKFMGSSDALNRLGINWYKNNVVEYIKSKDEY